MTSLEEMAPSSAREALDWVSAKIFSPKRLSSNGAGCPGKWQNHYPWKYLKDLERLFKAKKFYDSTREYENLFKPH